MVVDLPLIGREENKVLKVVERHDGSSKAEAEAYLLGVVSADDTYLRYCCTVLYYQVHKVGTR